MATERLQKFLARCGVGSRRSCETLILEHQVEVNGETVSVLGIQVDPDVDVVSLRGETVKPERLAYFALYKPRGVVCTNSDPAGRPRAVDLVPGKQRLYPIGRLDELSEGLLIMTNDGELAQRLAHPRFEVPKTYKVTVRGRVDDELLSKLRKGVWLSEGKTQPARVVVKKHTSELTTLLITIKEGRNRHIRRILARLGLPVKQLTRVEMGSVTLGKLKRGQFRALSPREIQSLRAGAPPAGGRGRARGKGGKSSRPGGTANKQRRGHRTQQGRQITRDS